MKLLNVSDIDGIHDEILKQSGGLIGKSPSRPLESVLYRVFNHALYNGKSNFFEIAALYAYSITVGHPYNDGNKRTAMTAMLVFLELNEKQFNAQDQQIVDKMVAIADDELSLDSFTRWVKQHTS